MEKPSQTKTIVSAEFLDSDQALTLVDPANPFGQAIVVPRLVADAGDRATKRFANFFGSIANDNTRAAYQRACQCFFAWCGSRGFKELADIEPIHVGAYIKSMAGSFEKPTIKQHLAAIRMLFDYLVTGQIVAINPAHAMRAPKHVVKTGKTTVLDAPFGPPASPPIWKPAARWRTPKPWPRMKVRARPSSMTALATRSRSTRWSGLRFNR